MMMPVDLLRSCCRGFAFALVLTVSVTVLSQSQDPRPRFGGAYNDLGARRQALVDNWVVRFTQTTKQKIGARDFYDEFLNLSRKTTFEAVTHALMTTSLKDRDGKDLGDALTLVEQVDSVHGEVAGAASDRQFRMYVRLTPTALETMARSQQFKRGADNTVFHKGFPISYRGQGQGPSVQISVATDGRRADIDVDYRASSFPSALFNGHLTAANSDVRAGDNYDRHQQRWSGFSNWWRGFFGVSVDAPADVPAVKDLQIPNTPRIGDKKVEEMADDFLKAWLVEGNVMAAMGYVSERSYACLAENIEEPATFDRGVAPFRLLANLKAAHDSLDRGSSQNLVVGTRLTIPGARVVQQPHHSKFVLYEIPDDVAARFDCESRLTLDDPSKLKRVYGNYFAATFTVLGRQNYPVMLLWSRERGLWKIASWNVGALETNTEPAPKPVVARTVADPELAIAARDFLENWLVRRDYDAAFSALSTKAYACYDLERGPGAPPSTSAEDAGKKLRAGLESAATSLGEARPLDALLSGVPPTHPAVRPLSHQNTKVFSLNSVPNAMADALECAARARGNDVIADAKPQYGRGFGMNVQFKMRSGDGPVLQMLWRQENNAWRITSYMIELP